MIFVDHPAKIRPHELSGSLPLGEVVGPIDLQVRIPPRIHLTNYREFDNDSNIIVVLVTIRPGTYPSSTLFRFQLWFLLIEAEHPEKGSPHHEGLTRKPRRLVLRDKVMVDRHRRNNDPTPQATWTSHVPAKIAFYLNIVDAYLFGARPTQQ